MNIFLTGGTGFIGSHFLKQSLTAGHSVRALRRRADGQPRIRIQQEPEWLNRQFDQVTVEDLQGCDVLVHLAAHSAQFPFDTISNCLRWNLFQVLHLFEEARKAGIRRYVLAGSCFEYGHSGNRYEAIPTDAPLEPINSYAASKAAASIALCQWANEHHLNLDLLRVFHVFGEGESEARFWPSLKRAALAGMDFQMTAGEQIRDFIQVKNVASTFLQQAEKLPDIPSVNVYNVGSGHPCSLLTFAQRCWAALDAKGILIDGAFPYRDNECMRYVPGESLLNCGRDLL